MLEENILINQYTVKHWEAEGVKMGSSGTAEDLMILELCLHSTADFVY